MCLGTQKFSSGCGLRNYNVNNCLRLVRAALKFLYFVANINTKMHIIKTKAKQTTSFYLFWLNSFDSKEMCRQSITKLYNQLLCTQTIKRRSH